MSIPLRVSDDGSQTHRFEAAEYLLNSVKKGLFRKLYEQVGKSINRKTLWFPQSRLNVLHRQMEIAAAMDFYAIARGGLQFLDSTGNEIGSEVERGVRVRRRNNIGGSRLLRHLRHFQANVE